MFQNVKERCTSVSQELLLLEIDNSKSNVVPIRVPQGLLTHLNNEVCKKLNKESDNA